MARASTTLKTVRPKLHPCGPAPREDQTDRSVEPTHSEISAESFLSYVLIHLQINHGRRMFWHNCTLPVSSQCPCLLVPALLPHCAVSPWLFSFVLTFASMPLRSCALPVQRNNTSKETWCAFGQRWANKNTSRQKYVLVTAHWPLSTILMLFFQVGLGVHLCSRI